MPTIEGGCLCGAVRYTSEADPIVTAVCHCSDCQKQSGTAFSIVFGVPRDALSLEGELAQYETVGSDSEQPTVRRFCPQCGSPIFSESAAMDGVAFVKAGTLDDTSWLQPQAHVWTDSAQPWVQVPEGAMAFGRSPRPPA